MVRVTAAEEAELKARAEAIGVSVPRLLFESAMANSASTDAEWKSAIAEIFRLRHLMATVANNANQCARVANAEGRFPEEAWGVVAAYRSLVPRVSRAVERIAGS